MNVFLQAAERWSHLWTESLWRASWQGAIAIAAVWILATWRRSASPRVVCWAWRLVCVKLLLGLVWINPIEIPVLPQATQPGIVAASADAPQQETILSASDGPAAVAAVQPRIAAVQLPEQGIGIRPLLMLAWLLGVGGFVALTAREWIFAQRLCRSSQSPSDELLANLCRAEASRLAIHRLPRIRLAPVDGPLLVGIWRPTIVLPQCAGELFDESELRLMLGHELAHLKRRDLLWNWLPTVVGWLLFFHPLVWLLKRGWFESQEAACDELLIQTQVVRPAEYGRLLLKLSTLWPSTPRTGLATAGVLGAYRNLERRILHMTRVKSFSRKQVLIAAALLPLMAAVFVFPWRLVAQQPAVKADEKPAAAVNQDQALAQSAENLRQIMSAMQTYLDVAGHFPAANSGWGYDRTKGEWYRGRPYLSWRVLLLPIIGQTDLFNKFKFNEPWDSEHNRALIPQMPAIYRAGQQGRCRKNQLSGSRWPACGVSKQRHSDCARFY